MTALMTVDETEEDDEAESENVAAAFQPTHLELRTSSNEVWAKQAHSGLTEGAQPGLSIELAGDRAKPTLQSNNGSLLQSLQLNAER